MTERPLSTREADGVMVCESGLAVVAFESVFELGRSEDAGGETV